MPTRLAFLCFAFVALAHGQTVLVKPYVQPGDGASLSGTDVKVLEWLTEQKPGEFTVEYGIQDQPLRTAGVERSQLDFDGPRPKSAKPGEPAKPTETPKPNPAKDPALTIDELKAKTIASFGPIVEREQHYYDITGKYISDKHSFSVIELTPTSFELRQISIDGKEVDRFRITK
jgi:hypothetical protein